MRKKTNNFKKIFTEVFLGIIVLISMFLRFYKLPETMLWWDGDTAEDMTIAAHIVDFGEKISTGRESVGGGKLIVKSYLIYYFLAGAWLFTDSPISVGILYALSSVLVVVGMFYIGKYFLEEKYSLILALMVAINWYFNFLSRALFHASLVVSVVVLIIWALLKSEKEKSWEFYILFILVLFTSLHIHQSVFTILPIILIWAGVFYFRITNNKSKTIKRIIIIWTVILLGIWLKVTFNQTLFDQFQVVNLIIKSHLSFGELLNNSGEILLESSKQLLGNINIWWRFFFLITIYVLLGFLVIYDFFKKNIFFKKSLFIYSLIIGIFGAAWMGGTDAVHRFYVSYYFPFWCLAWIYVWWRLSRFSIVYKYLAYLILAVYLVLEVWVLSNNRMTSGGFIESKKIAQNIIVNAQINSIENFSITFYNTYTQFDNFGKAILWYHIEKILDKQMVKIVQWPPFIEYLTEINPGKTTYLLCSKVSNVDWADYENCEKVFIKNHQDKKYQIFKLDEEYYGDWPYKLFRFDQVE